MGICDLLNQSPFMLMEAAVIEALEHSGETHLHPQLENALLIYRETDQAVLSAVYQEFIDIARHANVPLVLCTPTWRANRERLHEATERPSARLDGSYSHRWLDWL